MTTTPFPPPPKDHNHIGSSFEDFLKEDGTFEDVTIEAIKRVFDWSKLTIYVLMEADPNYENSKRMPTGEFVLTKEEAETWSKDVKGKGWWGGNGDRGYVTVVLRGLAKTKS